MEDDVVLSLEEIKSSVKTSFTKIYAALKARELQTLRQLDVILCQNNTTKKTNYRCARINISYENESMLLAEIRKYGVIDFRKLKINEEIYMTEDYVLPDDDHIYSYKCIEEDCRNIGSSADKEIESVALKQITSEENCTCFVNVSTADVFLDTTSTASFNIGNNNVECKQSTNNLHFATNVFNHDGIEVENDLVEDLSNCVQNELQSKSSNISPTQEWLDYIKDQTETEPTHLSESMEHSAIACTP